MSFDVTPGKFPYEFSYRISVGKQPPIVGTVKAKTMPDAMERVSKLHKDYSARLASTKVTRAGADKL